jgi:penicillin-binding protein 1A
MPSQPLPRLPRAFSGGGVDWRVLRARLLGFAVAMGLATHKPPLAAVPPLFPGLRLPDLPAWSERRSDADRAPATVGAATAVGGATAAPRPEHRDVTNRPAVPALDGPLLTRTAARLGILAVGTAAGAAAIFAVGAVLTRPAVSNAKSLVHVELDIPEEASLPALEERSTIYDQEGNLLAVIDREISRRTVPLKQIPPRVRNAVIVAEDRKFYEHDGYDVEGISRALVANLQAGDIREGGSTITQQLAKSEVGNERTLERKASELLYAMALEDRFSKDELLERYLNQVYFGSRAYGIAAAAEEFFHTTPRKLKVHQAALLASMIRAPNSADPRDQKELALSRRNAVLRGMVDEGYLEPERLERLLARPLGVKESSPKRKRRQPHVVDAVERELLTLKALGKNRKQRERALYYGGLRITATIDLDMQTTAAETIRSYLPSGAPTAAIATVDPATGEVKAIASGLGYDELKYDLPTQGRRQPGSAMKPFVYAAALQDGFPIGMSLNGASPAYFDGVPGWERDCSSQDKKVCGVSNYGGSSYGNMDMPQALKNSVNTAAAQLTIILGPKRVAQMARQMNVKIQRATNGIITESIGLGGLDQGVTPLEMASAYGVFANDGKRIQPYLIDTVQDRNGKVLYEAKGKAERVLDSPVNSAMIDMMRGVVTGGTGTGAALPSWPVAGKTGTTSSNVDAWFVGYTPVLSTAVWVGHAKGQVQMPGMTGGSLPASIWRTYMGKVLDGRKVESFPAPDPDGLVKRQAGKDVKVPHVVRMNETKALTALGKRKLIGQVRQESSSAAAGTVIWQSPRAGETVSPGETVYIGVSTGYVPPPPRSSGGGGSSSSGGSTGGDAGKPPEEDSPPEEGLEPDGDGGGGGNGNGRGNGNGGGGD